MDTEGSDREERESPSALTRRAVCTTPLPPKPKEKLEESRIKLLVQGEVSQYN